MTCIYYCRWADCVEALICRPELTGLKRAFRSEPSVPFDSLSTIYKPFIGYTVSVLLQVLTTSFAVRSEFFRYSANVDPKNAGICIIVKYARPSRKALWLFIDKLQIHSSSGNTDIYYMLVPRVFRTEYTEFLFCSVSTRFAAPRTYHLSSIRTRGFFLPYRARHESSKKSYHSVPLILTCVLYPCPPMLCCASQLDS